MSNFLRFLLVGGVAAIANIGARALLADYMPFEYGVALAFLIGVSVAFTGNRTWVFTQSSTDWRVAYRRFFLVNVIALVQVWLVSVALYRLVFPLVGFTWHDELVAHVIGVLSPVVTSYYAHKHYSFKSPAM
jgi:putative flippase GtrA